MGCFGLGVVEVGIGKILLVWVKWVVIFWVTISGQLSFGVKWALFSGL